MAYKSLSFHPCQRPQLPSHSSVNNGHHGRFFLEPTIGRVRTKYRVRQQYPGVIRYPPSHCFLEHACASCPCQGSSLRSQGASLTTIPAETVIVQREEDGGRAVPPLTPLQVVPRGYERYHVRIALSPGAGDGEDGCGGLRRALRMGRPRRMLPPVPHGRRL
jgi:hypothetical protein